MRHFAIIPLLLLSLNLNACRNRSPSEQTQGLLEARQGYQTELIPNSYQPDGSIPKPPNNIFKLVYYPSSSGQLAAYITPDPGDGKKRPAMLWAHGGFGGIGSWFWEPATPDNDQTAKAFREAGIVLMVPSWRGENANPGKFELFFGEVEDLLRARDYLARLPYVDSERIYLAGHSTGGTLSLLAATAPAEFRAIFSFGGRPDVSLVVADGEGYGNTPFDYRDREESRLRSAINFVGAIESPTFYFEGGDDYHEDAVKMENLAKQHDVPFDTIIIAGGDHFDFWLR
ncbi:alpha/beta fold hydrolase [Lusitaniella coriacea LEGE 07157]|uniref:Alpha/beta fold hydrolase n=1 Tax=Lusitaniella coriacea LEGE 07157 TaxID=945747 RepID=A0A8J7JEV2_9CYAN|nr:alpha/beta fold hydrolase [Lusitaniella coriacea]MBE9118440.1 alpha/beta fold hydrolase [Lusitaniella coriacea LEGE 07157]